MKQRILFLCTGNSCRSQMAEGWTRHLLSGTVAVQSAGIVAKGLDPRAVTVMREVGIDISRQTSKTLASLLNAAPAGTGLFDLVVTVCDNARESCPLFPGKVRVVHRGFDDPPALAAGCAGDEEALACYRRVRDEIGAFVKNELARLAE